MKNWIKVNKKDLENTLSKNINMELSKTSDDIYSEIYLLKVKRINTIKQSSYFDKTAINDLIDAKLFSVLGSFSPSQNDLQLDLENKINELKELANNLESKINEIKLSTQTLDEKFDQRLLEMKKEINKDLDSKLDSSKLQTKLDDMKLEFSQVQKNLANVNREIQAQTRVSGKNFDLLIKKTTKMTGRLDVFDRDVKKIKAIPDIKKELVVKKPRSANKVVKVKALNAIKENVSIKQHKIAKKY